MSYGFKSINSDGITQIDGDNDNIAIFATGTAVAQKYDGPLDTIVPYPANLPEDILIFAKPSDPADRRHRPVRVDRPTRPIPRSFGFQ